MFSESSTRKTSFHYANYTRQLISDEHGITPEHVKLSAVVIRYIQAYPRSKPPPLSRHNTISERDVRANGRGRNVCGYARVLFAATRTPFDGPFGVRVKFVRRTRRRRLETIRVVPFATHERSRVTIPSAVSKYDRHNPLTVRVYVYTTAYVKPNNVRRSDRPTFAGTRSTFRSATRKRRSKDASVAHFWSGKTNRSFASFRKRQNQRSVIVSYTSRRVRYSSFFSKFT